MGELTKKYGAEVNDILMKAARDVQGLLGNYTFIAMWLPGGSGSTRYYVGLNDSVWSIGYASGSEFSFSKKRVEIISLGDFLSWRVTSHKTFLENLEKRENRTTLKEIATENEVEFGDLDKILGKVQAKGNELLSDDIVFREDIPAIEKAQAKA